MSTVIVEDDKKANLLLDKAPRGLRNLITIRPIRSVTVDRARQRGVAIHGFDEVKFYKFFSGRTKN